MNENKNQHELNVCLDECLLYIHSFLKGKKTVVKTLQIGLADGKLANAIVMLLRNHILSLIQDKKCNSLQALNS